MRISQFDGIGAQRGNRLYDHENASKDIDAKRLMM